MCDPSTVLGVTSAREKSEAWTQKYAFLRVRNDAYISTIWKHHGRWVNLRSCRVKLSSKDRSGVNRTAHRQIQGVPRRVWTAWKVLPFVALNHGYRVNQKSIPETLLFHRQRRLGCGAGKMQKYCRGRKILLYRLATQAPCLRQFHIRHQKCSLPQTTCFTMCLDKNRRTNHLLCLRVCL